MELSRKRRRELRRLRKEAEELLNEQRIVLGHAGTVVQNAGKQAKLLSDEHLQPRINDAVAAARPKIERSLACAKKSAERVRTVTAPFVTASLLRIINQLDRLEDKAAANTVRQFAERTGYVKPAKKRRFGTVFGVLVTIATAGIGYLVWQAFRDDDDLWVTPEN